MVFGPSIYSCGLMEKQGGGTAIAKYSATREVDGINNRNSAVKLLSISAMPVYKDKSHEELRAADYKVNDKGCSRGYVVSNLNPFSHPANPFSPNTQPLVTPNNTTSTTPTLTSFVSPFSNPANPTSTTPTLTPFVSPFSNTANPFSPKPQPFVMPNNTTSTISTLTPFVSPFSNLANPFSPKPQPFFTPNNTTPRVIPSVSPFSNPANPFSPFSSKPQPFVTPNNITPTITPSVSPFSNPTNPFSPKPQPFVTPNNTTSIFTPSVSPFSNHVNPFSPFVTPNNITPTVTPSVSPFSNHAIPFSSEPQPFVPPNNTTSTFTPSVSPFSNPVNPFSPKPQPFVTPNNTTSTLTPCVSPFSNPANPFSPKPQPFVTPNNTTPTVTPFTNPANPFSPKPQSFVTPNNETPTVTPSVSPFSNPANPFSPKPQPFVTPNNTTATVTPFVSPFSSHANPFSPEAQPFVTPNNTTPTPTSYVSPFSNPANPFSPKPQPFVTPNNTTSTTPTLTPSVSPFSNPANPFSFPGQVSTSNQTQPSQCSSSLTTVTEVANQNKNGQQRVSLLSTLVMNPFPSLPAVEISIGQTNPVTSIQYGISALPVSDNQSPVKLTSLLRARHVSLRQNRLPSHRYNPGSSEPKVPFFVGKEDRPCMTAAPFLQRENPRAWVTTNTLSRQKVVNNNTSVQDEHSPVPLNLHQNDAEVSALKLMLQHVEYYTEPSIKELEAKERAEPGFCTRVKNFVVGRRDKGSIKFLEETDIYNLDLQCVKFNDREVIIHSDDPVRKGLNKSAEVTLLNVKVFSKIGKQYTDGPQVDRFKKMLIDKAVKQGAEFVSYDPVQGEWKFRVEHF